MNSEIIGIIPARYASTRFPGKPLADIGGMTMIERVYRQASKAIDKVVVATDDKRIFECVEAFGGNVVMTSSDHPSGTDRVYEAYCLSGSDASVIINIQGDEPFVEPEQIKSLADCFCNPEVDIATLVRPFNAERGFEALFDPNLVKVVTAADGKALYFSRSVIPYVRSHPWQEWLDKVSYLTHVGMYGYRSETLAKIISIPRSPLEIAESLEQLRWLENGFRIQTATTHFENIGIDTPDDLEHARQYLTAKNNMK